MTDNDFAKSLECCTNNNALENCDTCPLCDYGNCRDTLIEYCSNIIKYQRTEIERLKTELKESYGENEKLTDNIDRGVSVCAECHKKYAEEIRTAKIEAICRFAERLEKSILSQLGVSTAEKVEAYYFCLDELSNLKDSMTEEKNEN